MNFAYIITLYRMSITERMSVQLQELFQLFFFVVLTYLNVRSNERSYPAYTPQAFSSSLSIRDLARQFGVNYSFLRGSFSFVLVRLFKRQRRSTLDGRWRCGATAVPSSHFWSPQSSADTGCVFPPLDCGSYILEIGENKPGVGSWRQHAWVLLPTPNSSWNDENPCSPNESQEVGLVAPPHMVASFTSFHRFFHHHLTPPPPPDSPPPGPSFEHAMSAKQGSWVKCSVV